MSIKKIISIILTLLIILSAAGCGGGKSAKGDDTIESSGPMQFTSSSPDTQAHPMPESPAAGVDSLPGEVMPPATPRPDTEEIRAVWVSYLELQGLMTNKSADQFRMGIAEVVNTSADFGLNTIMLQVRPFGDAIYPSELFPQSFLFTGTEGEVGKAPYDALAIAIEEAHKRDLNVEAWINPYRVRTKADKVLGDDNPVHDMLESGDAVKMGEVLTYDPASTAAQEFIAAGVEEIVKNYDVSGIHFDDYFYPTADADFDSGDYSAYKSTGGTKELAEWRRSNVTALVRRVHDTIAAADPSVVFGISPQGNTGNNLNLQFVDVEEIVKAGLIDYLCPQMYFGFDNSGCPYGSTIKDFNEMTRGTDVKLYVGLATYKFGIQDTWAGEGKDEWLDTTDILKRQVEAARDLSCYNGFVLYRYDSTFNFDGYFSKDSVREQVQTELDNLQTLL